MRPAGPSAELWAALRDASWFRNPSTNKPVRYHVVVDDAGIGGCGTWTASQRRGDPDSVLASSVAPALRCMRPGCRSRWPDPPATHS